MDLLADLNDSQRQAVTHVDGPLLVLAAAGSGKTRVITRRVAYLIAQGISPRSILAITFTNKAAGEMQRRVEALGAAGGATVATFHAFCARCLRQFAEAAGVPAGYTIYDAADQLRCVKDAIGRASLRLDNFSPAAVQSAISNAKNALQDPAAYAEGAAGYFGRQVGKVYRAYERILRDNHALDFDDLLLRTAFLMRDRPEVRQMLADRYRYILIDEYQDTNHAQYVIAHGIALDHENLCATGDPDQSIYAWRGANIRNILEFEADYPNARVVRLEYNYRSVAPILAAAGSLIAHNRRRKPKDLLARRPGGQDVQVIRLADEHAEATEAADIVARLRADGGRYGDVAVFYRVNALSRILEEAFRKAGIPYQIARGVEFYNRKEIKDVLAYLHLLINPADDLSCRRVINVPPRGIGDVTVGRLAAAAERAGTSLLAACTAPAEAGLGKAPAAKVAAFARLIAELADGADLPARQAGEGVRRTIEDVLARTGMESRLRDSEADRQALRNVQELVTSAGEFEADQSDATLADYLHQVSLVSDIDAIDPEAGAVTFMTLHAAKGLEFPAVIMVGCEEGILPFTRANGDAADVEEERRLAFVGMTRAMDRLFLTSALRRTLRGVPMRQVASPFLDEIGTGSVRRIDKAPPEPPPRRPAEPLERFGRRRRDTHDDLDVDPEALIEAEELAAGLPERFAGIRPGRRIHHKMFGQGQVVTVSYDGTRTRAKIRFGRSGVKTIILENAPIQPLN